MGIDIGQLSPKAQRQALAKIQLQQKAKKPAGRERERKSKYNASPTTVPTINGGIRFASKAEARRYRELLAMLDTGLIEDLRLQPQFTLKESYLTVEGVRMMAIRYVADFSYRVKGNLVVEDVKSRATRTRVYLDKRKLLHERYGITVQEVE